MVASGIVELDGAVLLVQNERRDGRVDWTPPGGVVEPHETVIEGLTREVLEETGLVVGEWAGPVWHVEAEAPDMQWSLRVEVYRALSFSGDLFVDDADGIVTSARFVPVTECAGCVAGNWAPVHEPLLAWLDERWAEARDFRYRIDGADRASMLVTRVG